MSDFPAILALCFMMLTTFVIGFILIGAIISHMKHFDWLRRHNANEGEPDEARRLGDIRDT